MDGFLLVLDKDGEILFASEGITEYVGLSQQDVVGQNLFDITQTDDAKKIEDCLKPSGERVWWFGGWGIVCRECGVGGGVLFTGSVVWVWGVVWSG